MHFSTLTILFTLFALTFTAPVKRQSSNNFPISISKRQSNNFPSATPLQIASSKLNIAIAYIICTVANDIKFAASSVPGTAKPVYYDQCEQISVSYPGFHGPTNRLEQKQ